MLQKLICITLCMILILGGCSNAATDNNNTLTSPTPSAAPHPTASPAATPSPTLYPLPASFYNSELIADCAPTIYSDTTYVPIIPAIKSIYPNASVDQDDNRVIIQADGLSVTINRWQVYVIANERFLYNPSGVLLQESGYYLPANLVATILGLKIQEDDVGSVFFSSGGDPLVPGNIYYDTDALFWLSHIINAESGNQSLQGKIAVGNVVLNRVKHPSFPNSIYDVLFQNGQFYDSYSGAITKDPNSESVIAAKLCLEGAVVLPNAYWYNGVGIPCWASTNKTLIAVIGDHAFYG